MDNIKTLKAAEAKVKRGWVHPAIKKHFEHNAKVKESRKQTFSNDLEGLVSDKVNHHFNVRRGRLVSMPENLGPVKVQKKLCFICNENDFEMTTGRFPGRFYCKQHKSVRYSSNPEQLQIRREENVKKSK